MILGHESVYAEHGWFVQSISINIPSKQFHSEMLVLIFLNWMFIVFLDLRLINGWIQKE